jgi:hypothetical protein
MSTENSNDIKETLDDAKNAATSGMNQAASTLKKVNSVEDALKLHWAFPLAGAILILLAHGIVDVSGIIPGLIAVVCIGLSVWTFIQSNGGKPNPVKLTWLQLGLPGAVLLIMLLFPGLSYGAAGVLGYIPK